MRIYGPADDVLPAEPEDDVPHGVHDAAGHPATLLLLLLGQPCNRYLEINVLKIFFVD